MKIDSLTIENFKCFKAEKTFDFGRITILTGANSSGKSSVMYAFLAAIQSGNFPFNFSLNGKYVNLGDFIEITNKNNANEIKLKICQNSGSASLKSIETSWSEELVSSLPVASSIVAKSDLNTVVISQLDESEFCFEFIFDSEEKVIKIYDQLSKIDFWQLPVKIDWFNARLKVTGQLGAIYQMRTFMFGSVIQELIDVLILLEDVIEFSSRVDKKINFIGAFRQQPLKTYLEKSKGDYKVDTEGQGFIDQIVEWEKRGNGNIKALVEKMKDMELIEDIKINRLGGGRLEVLVKAFKNNLLTSLSNVGFGVSQFMPIMVADLQLSNDSTLFLAEPEIHLHPSVQSKFGDYIINQINTSDKNYVIETHSEYFLNKIRLAIVKGELKKEDIKVYFLENNGNDTDVYDIDFTKTGAIKNAPNTFFDTYFVDSMNIAMNAFAE